MFNRQISSNEGQPNSHQHNSGSGNEWESVSMTGLIVNRNGLPRCGSVSSSWSMSETSSANSSSNGVTGSSITANQSLYTLKI